MAFLLQSSRDMHLLLAALCKDVKDNYDDPFRAVYIVTQTDGMNNWLRNKIAVAHGIAANIIFVKPNDIINRVYRLLGNRFEDSLQRTSLTWMLYDLLSNENFITQFPAIAHYYTEETFDKDIKRMSLAEKVADLFDQYQVYRPDVIEEWNAGNHSGPETLRWQSWLWQEAAKLADGRMPDKTIIGKAIKKSAQDPNAVEKLQEVLPTIYFFGLSVITDYHLGILQKLSEQISIRFYLLNPAPNDFWFEDMDEKKLIKLQQRGKVSAEVKADGNPLLHSWGGLVKNTFSMLFNLDEVINSYESLEGEAEQPITLLQHLQTDIAANRNAKEKYITDALLHDGSVAVQACYSPVREVEALYNYLADYVQKNKSIQARDVVVMVPDIERYAPLIHAVFSNAKDKFPYAISDEQEGKINVYVQALQAIMLISPVKFGAEEVLRLLEEAPIKQKVGITDTKLVRRAVDAANIRFGMTGSATDETEYVSWQYGLKRIVYGLLMQTEEQFYDKENGFFPVDIAEGDTAHDLIRFTAMVQNLMKTVQRRNKDRDIIEWIAYLQNILQDFIADESTEGEDYLALQENLDQYARAYEVYKEKISFEVFSKTFLEKLVAESTEKRYASRGITFCSLIPMRSIPFKIVAMLGLNFDSFPRRDKALSFDLMEIEKRKGDRSVKQNDKHLFMETLLSARDKFYLSYLGQSTADNTMLPPSSVVEELLQYISDKAVNPNAVEEVLVTRQPLHSYSKRYNREVALPNYLLQSGAVSSEILLTEPRKVEVVRAIPYQNFILAITEPIKYFYTKILQVRGEEDDEEIEDTELFELDGLQNWALKKEVSTHAGEAREKIEEGLKKKGMLPLLNAGKLVLEGVEEKLGGLPLQMLELTDGIPSAAIDFSLDVDGQLIDGKINNIYDKKYVAVCFSGQKSELKHLIKSFIDYSILCAAGLDYDYYFSSTESQQIFTGSKIEKDKALEILRELLPLYFLAGRKPIGFALDFLKEVTEVPDLNNVDKWIQQDYNNIKRYAKPFIDNQFEEGLFTEPEYFTDFELFYNATIPAVMEFIPTYFG